MTPDRRAALICDIDARSKALALLVDSVVEITNAMRNHSEKIAARLAQLKAAEGDRP